MPKKESTTLSLLMSGFSPTSPMVVIRPKNMANQRLLINYTGTAEDVKLTLEEVKQALGILTRRYGKVEKLLTARDFLGMLMHRSEIDNDFKIKVSHVNFHIMFGYGGKRYFVLPAKNDIDVLSFGTHHHPPAMISTIATNRPGAVARPTRPAQPLAVLDAMAGSLSTDHEGISINEHLVIPPAIKSTIDKYLKD